MTIDEIEEFASRWQVAKALNEGRTQREIAKDTGVSITTVTRVNQWLKRGMGGYKLVLKKLSVPETQNPVCSKNTTGKLGSLQTSKALHHHPHRG